MGKRERTRQLIIEQSAILFNKKGYAGTSISDIEEATGLKKGGIYGNFQGGKQQIAVEAFDYAVRYVTSQIRERTKQKEKSYEKLLESVRFYREYIVNPPLEGGCPILNIAPEVDDVRDSKDPRLQLRTRVKKAYDNWRSSIIKVVEKGIAKGEINTAINAEEFSTIFVAMMEGGILIARSYNNPNYLHTVLDRLELMIREELIVA